MKGEIDSDCHFKNEFILNPAIREKKTGKPIMDLTKLPHVKHYMKDKAQNKNIWHLNRKKNFISSPVFRISSTKNFRNPFYQS